jgi:sugar lactone lactonase YvrE
MTVNHGKQTASVAQASRLCILQNPLTQARRLCHWKPALVAAVVLSSQSLAQESKPAAPASDSPKVAAPAPAVSVALAPSPLDAIVAPDVKPVAIVTGLKFSEGPVWRPFSVASPSQSPLSSAPGCLYFSDIPTDTVYSWTPEKSTPTSIELAEHKPTEFLKPSNFSNGLTLDSKGALFLAQHAGKVSKLDLAAKTQDLTTLAEKFEGKSLSSPNDLVIKSDGSIYFTDPPYGVRGSLGPKGRTKELDFSGIYRFAPDGTISLLNKSMPTPNGLAFSPDEKTLYVADTSTGNMRSFAVKPDGSLEEGKLFAALRTRTDKGEERSAGGDGVKVDVQGRVYCAARGGVWVFSPTGEKLGVIALPNSPTNLCFGGPDMKTLFATTANTVYALPVKVEGRR